MKKKIIIILGIILILVFILFSIQSINRYLAFKKYKDIGYNRKQIELIYQNISIEDRKILLENKHLNCLDNMLLSDSYIKSNFVRYIDYINNNSIEEEKIEDVLLLVNQGIINPYSDSLIKIVKEPYFIKNRLERYLNYLDSNSTKKISKVIQLVNCNLDIENNLRKTDVSKGPLMLVNSLYFLDKGYTTDLVIMEEGYSNYSDSKLNREAYEHFKNLVNDAEILGYHIRNNSSYRSYYQQEELYNQYLRDYGINYTKKYASKPGYSEHQTGYSLDVGVDKRYASSKFQDTKEFLWMKDNSYKYGFILRYTQEGQEIFGYGYEPWHYRYVGVEAATYIYEHNITFEEYYGYFVEK